MRNLIAIDGPAGSGKSTIARALAERLGWSFLDTGAMYRAVTYLALTQGVAVDDVDAVTALAKDANIDTLPRVVINQIDVTESIREPSVNVGVSTVASLQGVREAMVKLQRQWASRQEVGTVVEGRDIGTVVFPDASLKVFLTASAEARAARRGDESSESIERRDRIDSSRSISPLRADEEAVVIDTSELTVDEVIEEILRCLENR